MRCPLKDPLNESFEKPPTLQHFFNFRLAFLKPLVFRPGATVADGPTVAERPDPTEIRKLKSCQSGHVQAEAPLTTSSASGRCRAKTRSRPASRRSHRDGRAATAMFYHERRGTNFVQWSEERVSLQYLPEVTIANVVVLAVVLPVLLWVAFEPTRAERSVASAIGYQLRVTNMADALHDR